MAIIRKKSRRHARPKESKGGALSLVSDPRGATMVMGIFIAVLLVGMVYYVWGIGDAALQRERMQDASDAGAFAAAVIHAHGMNALASLNMVMAALATLITTLKIIHDIAIGAMTAAGIACLGCAPSLGSCTICCEGCVAEVAWIPRERQIATWERHCARLTEQAMNVTHRAMDAVKIATPLAAAAKVTALGAGPYSPPVEGGLMLPLPVDGLGGGMPVEDDTSNYPCDGYVYSMLLGDDAADPAGPLLSLELAGLGSAALLMLPPPTTSSILFYGAGLGYGAARARGRARESCGSDRFMRVDQEAVQGDDNFQVQAYYWRDPAGWEWTQEGVAVATWGQEADSSAAYTAMRTLSRLSFAQGEYYYDEDQDDSREWLWHPRWKARLRRWRMSAAGGDLLGACGEGCGGLGAISGALDSVVVH